MSKRPDYIDEHQEWQENQFNPGHYLGTKGPVWLRKPGNVKWLGIGFIGLGFVYIIPTILELVSSTESQRDPIAPIVSLALSCLFILVGVKYLRKNK